MKRISLNIPAEAEQLDVVRLCLYGIAVKLGFTYEDIEDMKVAVSEACNNAILHGAPPEGAAHEMDIAFEWDDNGLSITVKDNGSSFDAPGALRTAGPYFGSSPGELNEGGLGLYLMQALMDDVTIHTDGGTEVILSKRLHL